MKDFLHYEKQDSKKITPKKINIAKKLEKLSGLELNGNNKILNINLNNQHITFKLEQYNFEIITNKKHIKLNNIQKVKFENNKIILKPRKTKTEFIGNDDNIIMENIFDKFSFEIYYLQLAKFIQ